MQFLCRGKASVVSPVAVLCCCTHLLLLLFFYVVSHLCFLDRRSLFTRYLLVRVEWGGLSRNLTWLRMVESSQGLKIA